MYTLFSAEPSWSVTPAPVRQVYYGGMPTFPMLISAPAIDQNSAQKCCYQVKPAWYVTAHPNYVTTHPNYLPKRRLSSDDVFLPEGTVLCDARHYGTLALPPPEHPGSQTTSSSQAAPSSEASPPKSRLYHQARSNSGSSSSESGSPDSLRNSSGYHTSPESALASKRYQPAAVDIHPDSNSSRHDDSIINSLIPAALSRALNEDPPEPVTTTLNTPVRTSSPNGKDPRSLLIDISNMRKRRGRFITSSSSEKCPRFSENGVCEELDQCDKILLQSRTQNAADEAAKRRQEFLLILEAERERQRKLVLPKHAPKMGCKFCKNNGEDAEVYTKHRLHYNEKTVCPLLRHYVCRLCNSTGDFAHTIRHCPFNDKKDKIAWKATFLA